MKERLPVFSFFFITIIMISMLTSAWHTVGAQEILVE